MDDCCIFRSFAEWGFNSRSRSLIASLGREGTMCLKIRRSLKRPYSSTSPNRCFIDSIQFKVRFIKILCSDIYNKLLETYFIIYVRKSSIVSFSFLNKTFLIDDKSILAAWILSRLLIIFIEIRKYWFWYDEAKTNIFQYIQNKISNLYQINENICLWDIFLYYLFCLRFGIMRYLNSKKIKKKSIIPIYT